MPDELFTLAVVKLVQSLKTSVAKVVAEVISSPVTEVTPLSLNIWLKSVTFEVSEIVGGVVKLVQL